MAVAITTGIAQFATLFADLLTVAPQCSRSRRSSPFCADAMVGAMVAASRPRIIILRITLPPFGHIGRRLNA